MFIFAVNKSQRLCKKTAQRKILWNLTVPVKEITSDYHCAIVIPPTRMSVGCDEGTFRFPEECCFSSLCSDEGSLFPLQPQIFC